MISKIANGLFLAIVLFSTVSGGSVADTVPKNLANEKVWEAILYAYTVDPDAPSYLDRANRIFDVGDEDVIAIFSKSEMKSDFQYSDSEETAASHVAASMSVEASFGAFSTAASMEVSSSSDSSIKTVRMDATTRSIKYQVNSVGNFRTFPDRYLTDNFKESVKYLSVQDIEKLIGVFFVRSMDLGGEVRKSYTMQATASDTASSVQSELEASYGSSLFGVSAKASVGVSTRETNKNSEMRVEWSAKGGDTTVWLGGDFEDAGGVGGVQDEWSKTITNDNLYPFDYELGLMWDLVKAVDQKKGEEFQQYLMKKWEDQANKFAPTRFLTAGPPVPTDKYSWSAWSSTNMRGDVKSSLCPPEHIVVGLQWREQNGYGLIDLDMDCGYGSVTHLTGNRRGGPNGLKTCKDLDHYGFHAVQGRDQWGYGIINTEMQCNGDYDWTLSNGNMRGAWNTLSVCPEKTAITGIEVRDQWGYGIVNFRYRCSEMR